MPSPWYQRTPEEISLPEAQAILDDPSTQAAFPAQWDALFSSVSSRVGEMKDSARLANPLAFIQPSYEQTLKLNAWIGGYDYILDFDANRIGKTTGNVINALLWVLPNDPQWCLFSPFTDQFGRTFQTIPRPRISSLRSIRSLRSAFSLKYDPTLPPTHQTNLLCYKTVLDFLAVESHQFAPPPIRRTLWVGGPDFDWIKANIYPEFLKWIPRANLLDESEYNKRIRITYPLSTQSRPSTNPGAKKAIITILFKSYDSKDSSWSGGAVDGILLSEGLPHQVFNEVKQRYKYPAFGGWDYTPYEPRNTGAKSALAHAVFKGTEPIPLSPFIYSGFGIVHAPDYIMPPDKKADMMKSWADSPEGEARIYGRFYTNSPAALKNYDRSFHCLPITFQQLQDLYAPRPLIIFRGLDPGWGHVTACCWMALAPDNLRFIFKFYARSLRSLEERVQDIITLSGNRRVRNPKSSSSAPTYMEEPQRNGLHISSTFMDYHAWKTDEETKQPFATRYLTHGLSVRRSVSFGPVERAQIVDDALQPQFHLTHPLLKTTPGSTLYFLNQEPGVAAALAKIENVFYQQFSQGEKRGILKEAIQDFNDDELDALSYVVCPRLNYNSLLENFVTSQNHSHANHSDNSNRTGEGSSRLTTDRVQVAA